MIKLLILSKKINNNGVRIVAKVDDKLFDDFINSISSYNVGSNDPLHGLEPEYFLNYVIDLAFSVLEQTCKKSITKAMQINLLITNLPKKLFAQTQSTHDRRSIGSNAMAISIHAPIAFRDYIVNMADPGLRLPYFHSGELKMILCNEFGHYVASAIYSTVCPHCHQESLGWGDKCPVCGKKFRESASRFKHSI
jgi:hypothetical protein